MSLRDRTDWSHHVDQVIRARRYTWLGEGLAGEPIEEALVDITTDIMHICERLGIDWEQVLAKSRSQLQKEDETVVA